jgi:hypothetical protein
MFYVTYCQGTIKYIANVTYDCERIIGVQPIKCKITDDGSLHACSIRVEIDSMHTNNEIKTAMVEWQQGITKCTPFIVFDATNQYNNDKEGLSDTKQRGCRY